MSDLRHLLSLSLLHVVTAQPGHVMLASLSLLQIWIRRMTVQWLQPPRNYIYAVIITFSRLGMNRVCFSTTTLLVVN